MHSVSGPNQDQVCLLWNTVLNSPLLSCPWPPHPTPHPQPCHVARPDRGAGWLCPAPVPLPDNLYLLLEVPVWSLLMSAGCWGHYLSSSMSLICHQSGCSNSRGVSPPPHTYTHTHLHPSLKISEHQWRTSEIWEGYIWYTCKQEVNDRHTHTHMHREVCTYINIPHT